MNPYRTALGVIGALALVAGAICIAVGTNMSQSYYRADGMGAILWGGSLLGLGSLSVLLWLVTAALTYSPSTVADRSTPPARAREWDEGRDGAVEVS